MLKRAGQSCDLGDALYLAMPRPGAAGLAEGQQRRSGALSLAACGLRMAEGCLSV